MTISPPLPPHIGHNQQTFDTCIALALQLVASIEFGPVMAGQAPPSDMLLDFARQLDRHADDIARLARDEQTNIQAQGWSRYQDFRAGGALPLHVAYRALHTAAYLALEGGQTTAVMLSVVACAVRELAFHEEERTYH